MSGAAGPRSDPPRSRKTPGPLTPARNLERNSHEKSLRQGSRLTTDDRRLTTATEREKWGIPACDSKIRATRPPATCLRILISPRVSSMGPSKEQEAKTLDTFLDFAKRLAEISVFLGALLFLIGWSYLFGYFSGFGLSADDLGLSSYDVLIHCIPVIQGRPFIITLVIVGLVILALGYFGLTQRLLTNIAFLVPAAIIGVFATSSHAIAVGRDNAHRDSYVPTTRLPYVILEGSLTSGPTGCDLAESNYRLLLRSNGHIFVVLPIDADANAPGAPNLRVCSFPDSRVQSLRIQVGLRKR